MIEQVIENLGLNETYDSLREKISINNPTDSRLLQITVTDTDNDRAKEIADEMADVVRNYIGEKMNQDPPNVTYYGYSDWNAVSPNIIKNTAIGCLFGMFLSMAVVVMSFLFNDSIMSPEDVEKKVGLNVLGILPLEENEELGNSGRKRKRRKRARE